MSLRMKLRMIQNLDLRRGITTREEMLVEEVRRREKMLPKKAFRDLTASGSQHLTGPSYA
jgi:hypothetical protein